MNSLPPLDDHLELLLAPAREVPALTPERTEEALEAVRGAVARGPAPVAPSETPDVASAAAGTSRIAWRHGSIGLLLGVLLGAAGATLLVRTDTAPSLEKRSTALPEVELVEVIPGEPAPRPTGAVTEIVTEEAEPPRARRTRRPRPTAPAEAARTTETADDAAHTDSLLAERRLIDAAFAQVNRGQPAAALTTLDRHQTNFERGQLRESRDALRIRALRALGRNDEARALLARFAERYPSSLALPSLRSQLERP